MKKLIFLTILSAAGFVSAEMLHIQCRVYGLPVDVQITDSEDIPFQDIVQGDFTLDTKEVFANTDFLKLIRQHNETDSRFVRKALFPCSAAGMKKSKLFGEPNGTRLQISAFQCESQAVETVVRADTDEDNPPQSLPSNEPTYYLFLIQKIIINGLPVLDEIPENISSWNLAFNEWTVDVPGVVSAPEPGDLLLEQEPIHLPEGSFKFVESSCRIVRETEDETLEAPANEHRLQQNMESTSQNRRRSTGSVEVPTTEAQTDDGTRKAPPVKVRRRSGSGGHGRHFKADFYE